jgi:spore germination protein GerM
MTVSRRWAVWLVLAALIGALTGCGLSPNDDPQAIATDDLPADLVGPNPSTSTTLSATATTAVTVYLLTREGDTTRLTPVRREVGDATRPGERIDALLQPTTEKEQADGLISSIPTDTVLLKTELNPAEQELIVDLSGALFDVQGKELANAFAQLVWTVTEMAGVRQVRFRVDGEPYRAPNAEGIEQPGAVTSADYRTLAPR